MAEAKRKRLTEYIPDDRNANKGTQRGYGALEHSLRQYGAGRSVLVDKNGKLIAGNKTVEKSVEIGLEDAIEIETDGRQIVVVKRMDLDLDTDPEARALAIADNRVGELSLEWSPEVLAELAQETDLSQLFTDDEMAALLQEVEVPPVEDEPVEIAQEGETRVKPGDVWRAGPHIVACLDSTEPGNLDRVLGVARRKPRMVVADPPYGIDIVAADGYVGGGEKYDYPFGGVKNRAAAKRGIGTIGGDKPFGSRPVVGTDGADHVVKAGRYAPVMGDDSIDTAVQASALCLAQYPDATHFWWGANNYAHVLPPSTCWIVWDKENTGNFADAELAWSSHKSAVRIFKHMWNGMLRESEHGRRTHPTQKPQALFSWLYERYGSPGDLILDPFLGSGPSLKAAHQMGDGRTVVGFELSPHYCDHILEWAETHGLTCERVEP